jgi:Ca-activated chloride channel homolog
VRWVLPLIAAAAPFWTLHAASAFARGAQDLRIRDDVELVVLDAEVRDAKAMFVPNLGKGDFRVYDNGKPQEISQFEKADLPVAIGLVVDNSVSMGSKKAAVVSAALSFAGESNPGDEFFVVNFNEHVRFGLPRGQAFSSDLHALRGALYLGRCEGQTALYDAVRLALDHLKTSHLERRTLIVVSDGKDNASRTSAEELFRAAQSSETTIYTVGLASPGDEDFNAGPLRKLANISGGEFFQPLDTREASAALHRIAQSVRARYLLAYAAPAPLHGNGDLHRIRLTAHRQGQPLRVRCRTEYRRPNGGGGKEGESGWRP